MFFRSSKEASGREEEWKEKGLGWEGQMKSWGGVGWGPVGYSSLLGACLACACLLWIQCQRVETEGGA